MMNSIEHMSICMQHGIIIQGGLNVESINVYSLTEHRKCLERSASPHKKGKVHPDQYNIYIIIVDLHMSTWHCMKQNIW